MKPPRRAVRLVPLILLLGAAAALPAEAPSPPLTLEAVKIEPASPSPDTLCHLAVTLRNAGAQRASSLEFAVKANGQDLPNYRKRLFLTPVEPGATRDLRLLNFWSTEAGRPAPANGKLAVEVTLARASWVQKASRDGTEVWTPLGEVPGLPVSRSVVLTMGR